MQARCWILGVDEEQSRDMLPGTVSMGFPLVGDLSRFGCFTPEDDLDAERQNRSLLVEEFRLAYLGVLEAREHPVRRVVDPFGLWSFSMKAKPRDLVVVHLKKGEGREAIAIVEIVGSYLFDAGSSWPHRLPVSTLNLDRWKLPSPYSGWGNLFGQSADGGALVAMVEERTCGRGVDGELPGNPAG